MKVRHKHGYHASPREIDALLCIVNATKMDEFWFGEIREAKAQDGRTVHVVRDRERKSWLSFKYAVSLVDQGICSARDYVMAEDADVYENMLRSLGIIDRSVDGESVWCARFVSERRSKLEALSHAVKDKDLRKSRFRPMMPRIVKDGDLYSLTLSAQEPWSRSMPLWFARRSDMKLAFEAQFTGLDGVVNHVVFDGEKAVLAEWSEAVSCRWGEFMSPHDIVNYYKKKAGDKDGK